MGAPKTITAAAQRKLEAALDAGLTLRAACAAVEEEGLRMSLSSAYRISRTRATRAERETSEAEPPAADATPARGRRAQTSPQRPTDAVAPACVVELRPAEEIVAEILARFPGRPPPEAELASENLTQTIKRLRECPVDEVSLFRQLSEQHSRNLGVLLDMVPKPEPDPALDPVNLTMRDAVLHTIRSIVEPTRQKYFGAELEDEAS